MDWEAIVERSCRWGVGGHVSSVLSLSERLLGVCAPAWVLEQLPRLRPYRFERTLARYIALWPDGYTLDRRKTLQRIHRFLLARMFRMHPSLQFRPSRVFDFVRYVFSEEVVAGGDGLASFRRSAVLGAPFRLMRLLSMATSIVVHYVRRGVGSILGHGK